MKSRARQVAGLVPLVAAAVASLSPSLGAGCARKSPPDPAALTGAFPEHAGAVLHGGAELGESEGGFSYRIPPPLAAWRHIEFDLPRDGGDALRVHARGGFEVSVRELGVEGEGRRVERAVAYRRAGGTSYWTSAGGGLEEWLHLVGPRDEVAAAWEVAGARLEQRGAEVALLDEAGVARIWVSAPVAYGAGGRPARARLWARGARIELTVEADADEVLVDPIWNAVPNMEVARKGHTATRLEDDRVLVVGGDGNGGTALYRHDTNSWQILTGSSIVARSGHGASPLPNGDVLLTGGKGAGGAILGTCEYLSAPTSTWLSGQAPMSIPRWGHTTVSLGNGKVLVAGGQQSTVALASAELYDPTFKDWDAPPQPMFGARSRHTATRLGDGKALVAGGDDGVDALGSVELYEFGSGGTNGFASTASMGTPRARHTATLLGNGKVLVAGGAAGAADDEPVHATAEIYDPVEYKWTNVASMKTARARHTATLLPSGFVLVLGGWDGAGPLDDAELYDPQHDVWSTITSMNARRSEHTATLLSTGTVLITGGEGGSGALASAEIYEPLANGAGCASAVECRSGYCVTGVCCEEVCDGPCAICIGGGLPGLCSSGGRTDGPCDDGNPCTLGESCTPNPNGAGQCVSTASVVCEPPSNTCYEAGECNPATGLCFMVDKPDGTTCDDGNRCTTDDVCVSRSCEGKSIQCPWVDLCHEASCDEATGECEYREIDDCTVPPGDPPSVQPGAVFCAADQDCVDLGAAGAFCVSGICCDDRCDGVCESCFVPEFIGKCTPEDGIDLRDECLPGADCSMTCVQGACGPVGEDKPITCSPARCAEDGIHLLGSAMCSGGGEACPLGERIPHDCAPYRCFGPAGACRTSCSSVDDCAPPYVCDPSYHCVVPPSVESGEDTGCSLARGRAAETKTIGAAFVVALAAARWRRRKGARV
jgi:hypothetical protein